MVLGFKTQIKGKSTYFVEKILKHLGDEAIEAYLDRIVDPFIVPFIREAIADATPKKLTIRDDPQFLWHAGRVIHFATGRRTKHYDCFAMGECKSTSELFIHFYEDYSFSLKINSKSISDEEMDQLALDDGFDSWAEFCAFHMPRKRGKPFYPPGGFLRKQIIYF